MQGAQHQRHMRTLLLSCWSLLSTIRLIFRLSQYGDIVGPGSPQFDEAYFEISYLRAYTTALPTSTSVSVPPTQVGAAPTTVTANPTTGTPSPTQLTGEGKSGAGSVRLLAGGGVELVAAAAASLVWFLMSS